MTPYDAAHQLARILKESQEYREYKTLKDKVQQNEKARSMLKDFRKKQFYLEAQQMAGHKVGSDEMRQLEELQNVLQQNPLVGPYLYAEYKIARIIQDVSKIINDAVDLEMSEELKEISEEIRQEMNEKNNQSKDPDTSQGDLQ